MKLRLNRILLIAMVFLAPLSAVAAEESNGAEGGGATELPSFLSLFAGHDSLLYYWVNIIYALVVSLILTIIVVRVYAKRQMIPGPLQNVVEMAVEGMYNFLHGILGKEARKNLPLLGTLFFYILFMNLMGVIPGGHSPSTNINITGSMALIVFFYVQFTGITRLGLAKYLDHFIGNPRSIAGWIISPIMLLVHLVGELAKPVSLSLRLFGNITGEDILVAAFVGIGISMMAMFGPTVAAYSPIGFPINFPFILLGLLLSTIQALVFTLLSSIYILMMLPHEEHD